MGQLLHGSARTTAAVRRAIQDSQESESLRVLAQRHGINPKTVAKWKKRTAVGVAPLIEGVEFGALLADKAFDSNDIIPELNERGAKIVISQHPRRAIPIPLDAEMYKWRHLIENFFCKLKEFKRIAMHACKTDRSFEAMIYLAAAVINSR